MTLADYFPDILANLQTGALKALISSTPAFSFEEPLSHKDNLSGKIGIGKPVATEDFLKAFVSNKLNNLVQATNDDIAYELFIACIIQKKPKLFINNPLTILNAQDQSAKQMRVWQEGFKSSDQKEKIIESLREFIAPEKSMSRLADNILIVIDELFSNAMLNAPVDKKGVAFLNRCRATKK